MIRQQAASVFLGLLAACYAAGPVDARGSSGGENPWSAEHVGGCRPISAAPLMRGRVRAAILRPPATISRHR